MHLLALILALLQLGIPRPKRVVAIVRRGGSAHVYALGTTRKKRIWRLTKKSGVRTFLKCLPGRRLIWDEGGTVMISPLASFWKGRRTVAPLPKEPYVTMGSDAVNLITWDSVGRLVGIPDATGLRIFDVSTVDPTPVAEILPPQGMRMVHPTAISPTGTMVAYGALDSEGRPYLVIESITTRSATTIGPLGQAKGASMRGISILWSPDSAHVAAEMDISFPKERILRYFVVAVVKKGTVLRFRKGWVPYRFLGFDRKGRLLWWGQRRKGLYALDLKRLKLKRIWRLYGTPVHYSRAMDVLLVTGKRWRRCPAPRLLTYSPKRGVRRLLKWGKWQKLVAVDPSGWWALVRAGGACRERRPAHYIMKLDGTRVLWELPYSAYRLIKEAGPNEVALCP